MKLERAEQVAWEVGDAQAGWQDLAMDSLVGFRFSLTAPEERAGRRVQAFCP